MAKRTKGGVIEVTVDSKGTLKNLGRDARKAGKDIGSVARTTAESDRRLKSLSQQTSNSSKAFSKQAQTIQGGLVPIYATLAAQVFALSAAFRFLQESVNFRNLVEGQAAYGAATGNMFSVISKAVRNASNGLISYQDASQAVAIGTAAGLNAGQLERLGKAASDVSLALGRDVVDSFNRLIRGVTKAEPELLDELGIILRLDPALKQYAAQLGKSKEDLNQFERAQAVANFVLDQAESKFGKISDVIDPSAFALGKFQQAFNDMLNDLQIGIAGIVDFVAPFFTQNIQAFAAALLVFITSIVQSMLPNFDMIVAKGAKTVLALKAQIKQLEAEIATLSQVRTIKSKTAADNLRREGLADIQQFDPTAGSLSNQQISARLSRLRAGKNLSVLKDRMDDEVLIYQAGLEKMEAANKFHKGKEAVDVETAENAKRLSNTKTTLQHEEELLKQEQRASRSAKIMIGVFKAIYIAGFAIMIAQATKAVVKFLVMNREQRIEQEKQIKQAKDLANQIKDINNNLEKMLELRRLNLVDSPFTQFARQLQGQNIEKQLQELALLDPDLVRRGQERMDPGRGALIGDDVTIIGKIVQATLGNIHKFVDSTVQAAEDSALAIHDFKKNLDTLVGLSPNQEFVDVFEQMKIELEENGKVTPETTQKFLKLQKQIVELEQSARQFNQTSQDLAKGLTGLATSFAPKTTFMNIQGLVDTNRKALEDAAAIIKEDFRELFEEGDGLFSVSESFGLDRLVENLFTGFDSSATEEIKEFFEVLGINKKNIDTLAARVIGIIDQSELLAALQPILDASLITERGINEQLAKNKTFRESIRKDGSAVMAQRKIIVDTKDRELKIEMAQSKEASLQSMLNEEKIKKDPRMIAALEHALFLQKETTKQLQKQKELAEMSEKIRRDGLRNSLELRQETSRGFSLEHMFGVAGEPVTEEQIEKTRRDNPGMTRAEAITNLQQFNSELAVSETKLKLIEGLSTSIGTTLMDGFANAFVEVAKGTTTFADAFRNMAIQILADIAAMTMRMLILNTLFPGSSSTVPKNPINMSAANMDFGISQFQVGHLAGGGRDGGIMSSRGRSYDRGGIATGPDSGFLATLHGTEAVVPLGNDRSIPVKLKGETGGVNNITVNVNGATESSGQSPQQAKALGEMIQASTMEIIQREKRPGGVLSR